MPTNCHTTPSISPSICLLLELARERGLGFSQEEELLTPAGSFYPHSDTTVAFSSKINGTVAAQIASLAGSIIAQDGADGMNILLVADQVEEALNIALQAEDVSIIEEECSLDHNPAPMPDRQQRPAWVGQTQPVDPKTGLPFQEVQPLSKQSATHAIKQLEAHALWLLSLRGLKEEDLCQDELDQLESLKHSLLTILQDGLVDPAWFDRKQGRRRAITEKGVFTKAGNKHWQDLITLAQSTIEAGRKFMYSGLDIPAVRKPVSRSPLQLAQAWLLENVKDAQPVTEILADGKAAGHSENSLRTAFRALGWKSKNVARKRCWYPTYEKSQNMAKRAQGSAKWNITDLSEVGYI